MKNKIKTLALIAAATLTISSISSCSKEDDILSPTDMNYIDSLRRAQDSLLNIKYDTLTVDAQPFKTKGVNTKPTILGTYQELNNYLFNQNINVHFRFKSTKEYPNPTLQIKIKRHNGQVENITYNMPAPTITNEVTSPLGYLPQTITKFYTYECNYIVNY